MLNRVGLRASKIWATGWVVGGLTLAGCIPPDFISNDLRLLDGQTI